MVITGSRDLLPGEDTDLAHIFDVIHASHGALVPLTRESARQAAAPASPAADAGDAHDPDDDVAEYPASPVPGPSATPPVSSSRPTPEGQGVGILHVLWALLPALSFGILTPVPFVHAAVRLRDRRLWVIVSAYAIAWLMLFITLLATAPSDSANPGTGFNVAFAFWFALAVAATVHAFVLRRRVFARPSPPTSP